jgi:hypothetical protein
MSLVERDQSPEPRHELAHELPPSHVCCAPLASESVASERKREEKSLRANSPMNTAAVGDCHAQTPSQSPPPPPAALLQQPRDREDRAQGGDGDVHADDVRGDGELIGRVSHTECHLRCVCVYVYVCVYVCVCVHIHIYYIYLYIHTYTCIHVHVCTYTNTQIHIHTYTHIHTHIATLRTAA